MHEIRFASGFSGIGGFDLALIRCGFKRAWSCDNNKYANQVYTKHFGEENHYPGDIRGIDPREIPSHDLFCAGFPCQAFSVAGKRQGFKDTRGTLFFEICRIAEHHRPSMLLLENVKGLLSHDGGRTFGVILESLEELGYWWEYQVLNSKYFGVPQNRERVFIIGHLRDRGTQAIFPITESSRLLGEENLGERESGSRVRGGISPTIDARYGALRNSGEPYIMNIPHGYNDGFKKPLPGLKANSGAQYNELLIQPAPIPLRHIRTDRGKEARQESQKQGQDNTPYGEGFREYAPSKEPVTGTITTGINKDALIGHNTQIRRLTPRECERLQGFPDEWTSGISDTQRYKCLGNAVTVNVIEYLGELIKSSFSKSRRTVDRCT